MAMNDSIPACLPTADNVFGPVVDGCRDGFDFTLLFEQSIMSIVPSALLLLAFPVRYVYLHKQDVKAQTALISWLKLVSSNLDRT
jgi:hypothetical protein